MTNVPAVAVPAAAVPRLLRFNLLWRVDANGDFFEQDWEGETRAKALTRWRNFWGIRQTDCAYFQCIQIA